MQSHRTTYARRAINRLYGLVFKVIDYDKFFYRLGSFGPFRTNNRLRMRFLTELKHCITIFGTRGSLGPATLSNGLRIKNCDARDYVELSLYYLKGYSLDEQDAVARYLAPGEIFIDVGANIGVFTLMGARKVGPSGKVISFEPASDTLHKLKENAAINDLEGRIEILQYALSDENRMMTLYDSEIEPYDLGKRSLFQSGKKGELVSTKRFDDLVAQGEIVIDRPIGVIKIDVEGAELLVLMGMRETIKAFKPKMIIFEAAESLIGAAGSSLSEIEEFIGSCGYKVFAGKADDGQGSIPLDNLICVPA